MTHLGWRSKKDSASLKHWSQLRLHGFPAKRAGACIVFPLVGTCHVQTVSAPCAFPAIVTKALKTKDAFVRRLLHVVTIEHAHLDIGCHNGKPAAQGVSVPHYVTYNIRLLQVLRFPCGSRPCGPREMYSSSECARSPSHRSTLLSYRLCVLLRRMTSGVECIIDVCTA